MTRRSVVAACFAAIGAYTPLAAQDPGVRTIVVISDLHFGPGRDRAGEWLPFEDFRWGAELGGFLNHVRSLGDDRVDLVIAGDLFELWQHPAVDCTPEDKDPDFGCTVAQMEDIARTATNAHREELSALGRFASQGSNRLFVVPGNHDAGLLLDEVWVRVKTRLGSPPARAFRVASGRWVSDDEQVAVEHGHQIGKDVNRFADWPGVSGRHLGEDRLVRTWGEAFVDRVFNGFEGANSMIDNLQPMSASAKYHIEADPTVAVRDLGRLLVFNVLQTSFTQKATLAPEAGSPQDRVKWNVEAARRRGHRLVADAMEPEDPTRTDLLSSQADAWRQARADLDAVVANPDSMPEEEILVLCEKIALLGEKDPEGGRVGCSSVLAGALIEEMIPDRWVLRRHLKPILLEHRDLRLFVYGHTHDARVPWQLEVGGRWVVVANTGAFQRLVDEPTLRQEAGRANVTPAQYLQTKRPEDLPACYPTVIVEYKNGVPEARLEYWYVDDDTPSGSLIGACDERCRFRNRRSCPAG